MDSRDVVYYCCSVLAWLACCYKLRALWNDPRNPLLRLICGTLAFVAAVFFFATPATIRQVNRLTGISNFSVPLVYSLIIGFGAATLMLLLYWRYTAEQAWPKARPVVLVYGLAIAALITLFSFASVPEERTVDFDTYYATNPVVASFLLIYIAAHAGAEIGIGVVCGSWVRVTGRSWLRRGLWLMVLAAVLGLGFDAAKLVAIAARWFGSDLDYLSTDVAPACASLGVVCKAAGFTVPVWGPRLASVNGWFSRLRAYWALYPLWHALRQATPSIVPPVRLPWWDLQLRLTRRLTEIRDGQLALRSYVDPEVASIALRLAEAAGLHESKLAAVVEAAEVKAALRAKERSLATGLRAAARADRRGGTDIASELSGLVGVARAFKRSRLVAAAVAEASRTTA